MIRLLYGLFSDQIWHLPVWSIRPSLYWCFIPHLIAVGFSDRPCLICPTVPNVAFNSFTLFDFSARSKAARPHSFLSLYGAVSTPKFFDKSYRFTTPNRLICICRRSVFPDRTHFSSFCARTVVNNITAHIDKHFICVTHISSPFINSFSALPLIYFCLLSRIWAIIQYLIQILSKSFCFPLCHPSRQFSVQLAPVSFHFSSNIISFFRKINYLFLLSFAFGTQKIYPFSSKRFSIPVTVDFS